MAILLFWIGGAIATGMFASIRRNRNGFGWFVLALLISPILAFIFCAILQAKPANTNARKQHPDFSELPAAEQERLAKMFKLGPYAERPQPKSFEDLTSKSQSQKPAQPSKWSINPDNFND
jgi:phosphate/sulfate permease